MHMKEWTWIYLLLVYINMLWALFVVSTYVRNLNNLLEYFFLFSDVLYGLATNTEEDTLNEWSRQG